MNGAVALIALIAASPPARTGAPDDGAKPAVDDCLFCHEGLEARLSTPAKDFQKSVHRLKGVTCASCHGGNPTRGDLKASHDPEHGFRGVPRGVVIIEVCSRCHSDPAYMKRFNPSPRVDQEAEYWTSRHGVRLRAGDENVATCVGCHGAHGVLPVKDPASPVYPLNVARTCARCHADAERMKPYGLPTRQLDDYQKSVHHKAMVVKRDTAAATCNDCHGNHGATPPGAKSVAHVCGQCHTFFQQLFLESPHAKKIEKGCVACHGNHAIQKPSDEWLGAGPGQVCERCHPRGTRAATAADGIRALVLSLKEAVAAADDVLRRAQRAGLEVRKPIFELRSARDQLTEARKVAHGLDAAKVGEVIREGLQTAQKCRAKGEQALGEIVYRRNGLLASLGALALLAIALWLKLRKIEAAPRTPPE